MKTVQIVSLLLFTATLWPSVASGARVSADFSVLGMNVQHVFIPDKGANGTVIFDDAGITGVGDESVVIESLTINLVNFGPSFPATMTFGGGAGTPNVVHAAYRNGVFRGIAGTPTTSLYPQIILSVNTPSIYTQYGFVRTGSGNFTWTDPVVIDDVNVVPLPAAAWSGIGLLGAMAAPRLFRRKRFNAQAHQQGRRTA